MLSIKIGILESFRFKQIIKGSAEPANLNKDLNATPQTKETLV